MINRLTNGLKGARFSHKAMMWKCEQTCEISVSFWSALCMGMPQNWRLNGRFMSHFEREPEFTVARPKILLGVVFLMLWDPLWFIRIHEVNLALSLQGDVENDSSYIHRQHGFNFIHQCHDNDAVANHGNLRLGCDLPCLQDRDTTASWLAVHCLPPV